MLIPSLVYYPFILSSLLTCYITTMIIYPVAAPLLTLLTKSSLQKPLLIILPRHSTQHSWTSPTKQTYPTTEFFKVIILSAILSGKHHQTHDVQNFCVFTGPPSNCLGQRLHSYPVSNYNCHTSFYTAAVPVSLKAVSNIPILKKNLV